MQKPNTWRTGVRGTVVSNTSVSNNNYSAGTSFDNYYGDRYAAITVKSTQACTLYVLGSDSQFSSSASGASGGQQLTVVTGVPAANTAQSPDGVTYYVRIAGYRYVLPMVYNASGSSATVTISYRTFNE
jgi:hypothetical protein